ncbi:hypothetical protein T4B_14466 [Trichinella pseudospiralis]|uniref:Uncharacterized protein n=1 Tax=Trichinella pseudospiralis TaxID=6337 RepID=A0A0V1JL43_TRIPS|nr:hypothetical protein T4A_395 [Trichinella pseudospiralis]KRZ22599.1 hypothetical protein T4B_14466 [Trichinella pseudospiralis]KRZ35715.1 hypothetical protein T4C_4945 [Trichinella pseudospiralis]
MLKRHYAVTEIFSSWSVSAIQSRVQCDDDSTSNAYTNVLCKYIMHKQNQQQILRELDFLV